MSSTHKIDILRPGCTTMIVGKAATTDGSVIVAHSDDDVSDERVIYVPAQHHHHGEQRQVYYDNAALGPMEYKNGDNYNATEARRYIGESRGPGYNTHDYAPSIQLGAIPQVPHTFAYFDSSYGIMNEHQLMIGECTCGAKVHPNPEPGKRIVYSAELSRIALERCKQAKEAVLLIGQLIKDYGYYGTGETLLIGDAQEAWVMEMCGYDMDGADGLWVAQRVPDDGFFVAANQFRIREVKQNSADMLYSDNLFDVCKHLKWWDPDKQKDLDWASTVSWGEYSHPYYSLRRVWRAMSKVAPSLNLPAWVEGPYTTAYPFAIKPERKLSVTDVAGIYRDHYEGTEFDMTRGMAAGPFGDPTRYDVSNPDHNSNTFNLNEYHPKGAWERPISIYRCGMLWINQARSLPNMPDMINGVCWMGLDRPATNCLLPLYVGVTNLPHKLQTMNILEFSRDSAWWAFNFVANYATIKYASMIRDIVALQQELETANTKAQLEMDKQAGELYRLGKIDECKELLDQFIEDIVENTLASWWKLSEQLIVKYNNNCETTDAQHIMEHKSDYPSWWLWDIGYFYGPVSYKQ